MEASFLAKEKFYEKAQLIPGRDDLLVSRYNEQAQWAWHSNAVILLMVQSAIFVGLSAMQVLREYAKGTDGLGSILTE